MIQRDLDVILRPRSLAVIGASSRPGSIGRAIVQNLINGDFQGKVFPVNPNAEYIHSIKAYPTILDVPDPVDLAIVVVHSSLAVAVAEQCARKGVRGMLVITAGFREVGGEGGERERQLVDICRRHGIRLVGPNCLGVFNSDPAVSLNATFAPGAPLAGTVGFVSQSGALGVAVWTEMQKHNLGFSQFVSVGNKPDVTGNDLLEYWRDDPNTKLIAMYIESFGNPRRFTQLARSITRRKPILMVKSGRTEAGMRAASSHTGALSGLDAATDALLRQTGVIRARTIDDMMALMQAFTACPPVAGDRVAVLTNAGGPGILATDALIGYGLRLAELSTATKTALGDLLPAEASVGNPVDMIAGATEESFGACLKVLLAAEEVDLAIAAFVPPMMVNPTDVVRTLARTSHGLAKPVLMVLMAEDRYYDEIPRTVPHCPPLYRYPEIAAYAAAEMVNWSRRTRRAEGEIPQFNVDRAAARRVLEKWGRPGQYLDPAAAFELLETYRFPLARWRVAATAEAAVQAAGEVGFPVAVKLVGHGIVHKSDVGGVLLDIQDVAELEAALTQLDQAAHQLPTDQVGFLVQEMVTSQREVILGLSTDPVIGPILLFGMGGKYVEVLRDVALRVHPINTVNAREMVESIRGYPILKGVRGDPPVALDVVFETLLRLSALVSDFDELVEIDLNPLRLGPQAEQCRIVDVRIRLAD